VQGLQHETVAAEWYDDLRTFGLYARVEAAQLYKSRLRGFGFGRDDSDPQCRCGHPPVTLM
jgi:hypothetical protein